MTLVYAVTTDAVAQRERDLPLRAMQNEDINISTYTWQRYLKSLHSASGSNVETVDTACL